MNTVSKTMTRGLFLGAICAIKQSTPDVFIIHQFRCSCLRFKPNVEVVDQNGVFRFVC